MTQRNLRDLNASKFILSAIEIFVEKKLFQRNDFLN